MIKRRGTLRGTLRAPQQPQLDFRPGEVEVKRAIWGTSGGVREARFGHKLCLSRELFFTQAVFFALETAFENALETLSEVASVPSVYCQTASSPPLLHARPWQSMHIS